MLKFLLDKVLQGRSGAHLICAQLGTPIPLPYAHLLGFMVKIYNLCLAVLMGYLWGLQVGGPRHDYQVLLFAKVFFAPLLFNALLLIDEELSDPFNDDLNDFPKTKYQTVIESDGKSYVDAGAFLPQWLADEGICLVPVHG